jgi:hypothetical protein
MLGVASSTSNDAGAAPTLPVYVTSRRTYCGVYTLSLWAAA